MSGEKKEYYGKLRDQVHQSWSQKILKSNSVCNSISQPLTYRLLLLQKQPAIAYG